MRGKNTLQSPRNDRLITLEPAMEEKKIAFITGASSGIGEAAALALLKRGWIVYGGARRTERMQAAAAQGLIPLHLDVTDAESRRAAVQTILEEHGRLDALVNNAGYGSYGSLEEVSQEEAHRQFEVNVFGLAAMCQEVLPLMRLKGRGRIVNVSSMGGQIFTPMGGWYYAAKRAVEALSDCLRHEVAPFGIQVAIIEPGVIKTEWSDHAISSLEQVSGNGPYQGLCHKLAKILRFGYASKFAGTPDMMARLIVRAITDPLPKLRYAGPWDAKLLLFFKKYSPDYIFDAVVRLITKA